MKKIFSLIVANILRYVPLKEFRSGQQTVYEAICSSILAGHRTMFIEGPTGMGKSFIQSMIADSVINGSPSIKVLLLVPKITLLDQMVGEFKNFVSHLTFGIVGDGSRNFNGQVTIMTYQSFMRLKDSELQQYSVILLDEAHKALGEGASQKIERLTHAIIIGFTATATYDEKKNLKNFLKHEAYRISIREAVKVGMLSAIQFILGRVTIEISERRKGESSAEYQDRVGKDIIREGGNIAAARLYKKLFYERGIRFIMFTASVRQGHDLVTELRKQGISADIVHGDMDSDARRELFASFRRNEFKVLVGIDTIKEGFDDPGVHGVMFVYPIGSLVGLVQGGGRATRLDKLFPHKVAYIVQLMFKGKNQVFYSSVLEGETVLLPDMEEGVDATREFDVISSREAANVHDDIITDVSVEHEEVMRLVREYDPLDSFYSATQEDQIIEIKKTLAEKNITSSDELYAFGTMRFNKTVFLPFGRGRAFASRIVGRQIFEVTREVFEEILDILDWSLTDDEQKDAWRQALAMHGIISHATFLNFGIRKFVKTKFGNYGKGRALATLILADIGKYVTEETIDAICKELGWKMEGDEALNHWKNALAVHKITSRKTLLDFGAKRFAKTSFGDYGRGLGFAYLILGQSQFRSTVQVLEKIADKLGWVKDAKADIASWKHILAGYDITSYSTLMSYGVQKFIQTEFHGYGKGFAFAAAILETRDKGVTAEVLHEVALKLGWNPDTITQLHDWIEVLSINGITSRRELLALTMNTFIYMSFGPFGKGTAFATHVLGTYERPSLATLEKIADKVGWPEKSEKEQLEEWKELLKVHGINSRIELLKMGPRPIAELTFGEYGGILSFSRAILGAVQTGVNVELLENIAKKLGWGISAEEEVVEWRQLLAAHNILSRKDLLKVGPVPFKTLSFGDLGKGSAFAGIVLGESVKVNVAILEKIADKLGWAVTPEQQMIEWKETFKLHGITSRKTLCDYGQKRFKRLKFGDYGGGQAFAKIILGSLTEEHFTNNDLAKIADKLGW